jgi:hypothetical protein
MANLGEMLKAQNDERERQRIAAEEAEAEAARIEKEQNQRIIDEFIDTFKDEVTSCIMLNQQPGRRAFGGKKNSRMASILHSYRSDFESSIKNGKHEYSQPFLDLFAWGQQNGLQVNLSYVHDGMGMNSWYELTVEPL